MDTGDTGKRQVKKKGELTEEEKISKEIIGKD